MTVLGRYAPQLFALLRIVCGVLFALHGTAKLFGWPGDKPPVHGDVLMLAAAIIEIVGGVLIAIGFFTRVAAFISSGEMGVAFFKGHVLTSGSMIPLVNRGESAVLYCFLFLFIAAHGAGIWSIDGARSRTTI
jgi:putative oxidoreductase